METFLAILASIAFLPIVWLIAYGWMRLTDGAFKQTRDATIEVLTLGLLGCPPFILFAACLRFFGAKAGLFTPEVPPDIAELIWIPLWTAAAFGTLLHAARWAFRANDKARAR